MLIVRIWSTRNRVFVPMISSSGRKTAGWAFVDVGTAVMTLHGIEPGLMTTA
ncbi:hypothetical protein MKAN_22520 [Mycobacterium kansasii ATCC 12478]|uniref:Uncharacterized protein n=1 Tax=Mycobacterium kansasii ATCC 12478 TaxID=557599 RepID=U5WYR8_MYCKA|nr:hypothetical protein MKAN_22520 [Mycobacterium kansasii ATCC 12478]